MLQNSSYGDFLNVRKCKIVPILYVIISSEPVLLLITLKREAVYLSAVIL